MPIQHLSMILILRIKDVRLRRMYAFATPLETFPGFEMITPPLAVVLKYSWALGQFSLCVQSSEIQSRSHMQKCLFDSFLSMGRLNGRSWNVLKPRTWPWQALIVVLSIKQALSAVLIIIQLLSIIQLGKCLYLVLFPNLNHPISTNTVLTSTLRKR